MTGAAFDWLAPRLPSRSEYVDCCGVTLHLRHWGNPEAPLVVLLHGWMDCSATYQFMVDACTRDWHFVALDWCGYGRSGRRASYAFFDYLVDLDALLDRLSPEEPLCLVAHSMGANLAMLYAASRPERVKALVNMEGMASLPGYDDGAPGAILRHWLDSQKGGPRPLRYANNIDLAKRLLRANPGLPEAGAGFLAQALLHPDGDGGQVLAADPRLYRQVPWYPSQEQVLALWRDIQARVLFILGERSFVHESFQGREALLQERLNCIRDSRCLVIPGSGHNMHHESAAQVAGAVEAFFA
ncbi:alpha/beta fold hydrolase [Pseudomonas sp. H9]|uniref:alpha/beta fold hydrolase n=1 Tax=Pseudomonas sp. H9 TaxID=483968 RepID=UPI0010577133|nr:alpha/beta hydrolase [Pseudomonas sp. H9]TDF85959.1 alpha/beta hydrolase [Pseudomonas sp. H9]